jgi:uncharacterized protein
MSRAAIHVTPGTSRRDAAPDFYTQLFGWKIDYRKPVRYSVDEVRTGDLSALILLDDGSPGSSAAFYVQVDDLEASIREAEELGARTVTPPTPLEAGGRFALLADPQGHHIGLFQQVRRSALD